MSDKAHKITTRQTDWDSNTGFIACIRVTPDALDELKDYLGDLIPTGKTTYLLVPINFADKEQLTANQLAPHTKLSIYNVQEKMSIAKNTIYVLPNNRIVTLADYQFNFSDATTKPDNVFIKLIDSCTQTFGKRVLSITLPAKSVIQNELHLQQTQLILDTLPSRVWFKDTHNNIRRVNQIVCRDLNKSVEEIEGHNLLDLYPKAECESSFKFDKQVIKTGNPLRGIIHPSHSYSDGKKHWLCTDRIPIFDQHGDVTSILVISTDVTELQEARNLLEQTTRKFESFTRHSPLLKWALDENRRYIMVNPAYEKIMGVTQDQCLGYTPEEILQPGTSKSLIHKSTKDIFKTIDPNHPLRYQIDVPIDDKVHSMLVTKFLFELSNGRQGLGALAVDITDLKNTQAQLIEIKKRYELAIEGTADGLWDWDTNGYCWSSSRCKQLLGYTDQDPFLFDLQSQIEHIHPNDQERVKQALENHLEYDALYDVEFQARCKNGQYKWFRSRAQASRDQAGNAIRMSGSIQDIDERINAQRQLNQLNKELEDRVHRRTAQLANARDELEARVRERTFELGASNQKLKTRNNELDQFAHVAAHDLRSPLRTISGFGSLLSEIFDTSKNPEAMDYIRRILGAAGRMDELIGSLLDFSRIGRGEMSLELVNLNLVLENVKQDLQQQISESNAKIKSNLLPTVMCDQTMMRQLLQNLLANAINYASDQQPIIQISAHKKQNEYQFEIQDNGIGFSDIDLDLLFEPFKRLSHPSKLTKPGYGVGLSICRRVIERHQGKIWAHGVPDQGATFYFTLPTEMAQKQA